MKSTILQTFEQIMYVYVLVFGVLICRGRTVGKKCNIVYLRPSNSDGSRRTPCFPTPAWNPVNRSENYPQP